MATPPATRIARLIAELAVIQQEHASHAHEAGRGSYLAKNARERLHREWDEKYDLLRWLQLELALQVLAGDEACDGA